MQSAAQRIFEFVIEADSIRALVMVRTHFPKSRVLKPVRLGHSAQLPARHKSCVAFVERHRIEREQDVLLDPCGEVAQRQQYASFLVAIPHRAKCGIEGFLLLRLWQLGDFERVAHADLVCEKRFGDGSGKLRQPDTSGDVCGRFPRRDEMEATS